MSDDVFTRFLRNWYMHRDSFADFIGPRAPDFDECDRCRERFRLDGIPDDIRVERCEVCNSVDTEYAWRCCSRCRASGHEPPPVEMRFKAPGWDPLRC